MIINYVAYAIILGLVIWGAKFAGFKNNFHTDFTSLHVTRSLRGLSAICILLHHISIQDAFKQTGVFSLFFYCGIFFVSIFFFYSGYGLIKSIDTKPGYLEGFIKSRVVKSLVLPFYLNIFLCAFFLILTKHDFPISKWICGTLGITLLNEYAWYPIVLILLYLTFYFLFYNLPRRSDAFYFVFLTIIFFAIIFCVFGHFPFVKKVPNWNKLVYFSESTKWWHKQMQFWFHGEWWVNTNITFLMGMIFADKEKEVIAWFKRFYWVKLIATLLMFIGMIIFMNNVCIYHDYWSEVVTEKSGVLDRFVCYFVQQPVVLLFMILLIAVMMKYEAVNPITQFFGKFSLEIYLMNFIAIRAFAFLIYKNKYFVKIDSNYKNLVLYIICVLVTTVIFGVAFKCICKKVSKLFKLN